MNKHILKNNNTACKSMIDSEIVSDLEIINNVAKSSLTLEDVYFFKVRLCDDILDRVSDQMTHDFLVQFAEKARNIVGLKDHCWSVDEQWARLYDAYVTTDDNGNEYVEGKAYTLASNEDLVAKINAGIIKEVSVSFDGIAYCSICGQPMEKDWEGRGRCCNEHIAGREYDGVLCKSLLTECTDVFEFSIVSVPCQRTAGIKKGLSDNQSWSLLSTSNRQQNVDNLDNNNSSGGKSIMKKGLLALKKLTAINKAAEKPDEQVAELLDIIASDNAEEELTADDIDKLISENEELKARCKELEDQLKQCKEEAEQREGEAETAAIEAVLDSEIDKLCPLTPVVKENILRDVDRKSLTLKDGKVEGIDAAIEAVSKKYAGLFGKQQQTVTPDSPLPGGSRNVTKKSDAVTGLTFGA